MILDTGDRTPYASGAVRDMKEGKGRMDLLPLDVLLDIYCDEVSYSTRNVILDIVSFIKSGFISKLLYNLDCPPVRV